MDSSKAGHLMLIIIVNSEALSFFVFQSHIGCYPQVWRRAAVQKDAYERADFSM
jgi:hypothetical protein